jgi:AcrR family transcriptional regulator
VASGLSERTRQRTRREIADAAGQLFIEKGYAATTVKDIAEAADVSTRTFFRYFPSKDDVITAIASSTMDETIDRLGQHRRGINLLSALREMLDASVARVEEDPESALAFQLMLRESPVLRGRWLEEQRRSRDRLAEALAAWFPRSASPMAAHLAAGAAMLGLDVAVGRWADEGGRPDLMKLLDQALRLLGSDLLFLTKQEPPSNARGR